MKLSSSQTEALEKARPDGLRYIRGGYWVEAGTDTQAFLAQGPTPNRPWHCTTTTVQALVRRGLLSWGPLEPGLTYPTTALLGAP